MKYNRYDVGYAVRDENNSPKKFGYYTQRKTPVKMKKLIDEMSDDVYVDRCSSDDGRVCVYTLIEQIQPGDEVYVGTEYSFSKNRHLNYAYWEIIRLKGGKVFDLSKGDKAVHVVNGKDIGIPYSFDMLITKIKHVGDEENLSFLVDSAFEYYKNHKEVKHGGCKNNIELRIQVLKHIVGVHEDMSNYYKPFRTINSTIVENYVNRLNQKLIDLIANYENEKATAPFCQICENIRLLNSMIAEDKLTINEGE